jgi:antitoxin (DNA-binding transcriptional repressor) of toxin-antitoxin stability system
MIELDVAEAGDRLGEVLDAVEHRQESFAVTRDGQVIAEIVPVESEAGRARDGERDEPGVLIAHRSYRFPG